jgi:hypothetical protein
MNLVIWSFILPFFHGYFNLTILLFVVNNFIFLLLAIKPEFNSMKRALFVILLFGIFTDSYACDICGCSSGSYFIGPFPQFNRHFIGLQYTFRNFSTELSSDNTQFSKDFYQTTELLAGTRIGNRWQALMFLPYNINHSVTDDGTNNSKGFGDLTLLGNYNLFNKRSLTRDTNTIFQQLWIGGGTKLPTGKFAVDTSELVSSANMQPGTGSFDIMLNAIYSLQVKNWGLNINASYRINQSADKFKFGNRLGATAFFFRSFQTKILTLSPNIGMLYDNLAANENNNEKVADTGGNTLSSALGLEIRLKKISLGGNVQLPIFSDLSSGQTTQKLNGMLHLSFMF